MIILDEELQGLGLEVAISHWYRGAVLIIKQLRPGTVIKDQAIPALLRRAKQPTFRHDQSQGFLASPGCRAVILPNVFQADC
jgi:hypothetical protein